MPSLCSAASPAFAAAMLLLSACTPGTSQVPAQNPWFHKALTGMEVGPTGAQFGHSDPKDIRYCSRFDGRKIVRNALAAHAQYLVLWARDGDYAYYNSKLLPKAPGLQGRDPLREAVAEAHRHRMPLLAYCVVQQGGHFLEAHPEYEMRGADGQRLGRFCYNSGYLQAMKQIVAEQLAYGIDGFHIDMVDQGFGAPYGCWCDTCRAEFRQKYGHDMPAKIAWDSNWDEMLEFRYATSERFEKALREYIRSVNPAATVDFNYHGNPPFSFEVGQRPVQHAGNGDFVTGETGQWGFSALGVGLNAEFYRAATPGSPFQVAMQRGVRMYHDQTSRPLADMEWELYTLLAHGAFVTMVDKTGFEGDLDPVAYERIGQAFKHAQAASGEFGQQPVYDVGIFFSARTRDWVGRDHPAAYFQSFEGAAKMCAYEHLTYGVLLDENLSLSGLKKFPVVCLPNAGILSDREALLFKRYVEEGGKLIVTGQTGRYDKMGALLSGSSIASLVGAQVVGDVASRDNWAKLSASDSSGLRRDIPADWNFLVEGPATAYRAITATPIGDLMEPARTTRQKEGKEPPDWPMSPGARVGPAALVNHVGKGTVLTMAGSPDFATASDHHIVEARRLLRNAVRLLEPNPRVQISAPANVETIVTDDPVARKLRIHFVAYNSLPQSTPASGRPYVLPGLMEQAPIFRASVHTHFKIRSASALRANTVINQADADAANTLKATIESVHEVITLRY